ncbi:hypothetical protein CsSME_00006295 [Camellia sinensis var. sinensis]
MAPKALHLRHPNSPPHLLLHFRHQGPPNGLEYNEKVLHSIGNEVLKAVVAQFNADQLLIRASQRLRIGPQELGSSC